MKISIIIVTVLVTMVVFGLFVAALSFSRYKKRKSICCAMSDTCADKMIRANCAAQKKQSCPIS